MRIKTFKEYRPNGPPPRVGLKAASPQVTDEDCNSNTSLTGSQHSHDDLDAPCDNSGYLWFLDYNPIFRESACHHTSVLSSLSTSYKGIGDLTSRFEFTSRYNALARDLDANLAEADMESFKTQDIHALLMTTNLADGGNQQGEESMGSLNTMSICKSELLFSPVKEAHGVHFSVDSLDCELLNEQDLILTCQANKDNYTIAFEGSFIDESQFSEGVNEKRDKSDKAEELDNDEKTRRNLELLERCRDLTNKLTISMAKSDLGLTTWSKIKKQSNDSPLRRHPSGNNNGDSNEATETSEMNSSVIKSQSLPNLSKRKMINSSLILSNSTIDSFTANQGLTGTPICMKVYDVTHNRSNSSQEPMSTSSTEHTSSDKSQQKPFNLVKLFMKQKSRSNDGGVDELDRSECWPSSSGGESGDSIGEHKTVQTFERPKERLPDMNDVSETVYEHIATSPFSNRVYDDVVIEKESGNEDAENHLYATVNKHRKRIIPNVTNSPSKMRVNRKSCSSQSSATSVSISSCSESDATQIQRITRLLHKEPCDNKATSTHIKTETVDRSMQTSAVYVPKRTPERDFFKVVEPSFLEKLKEGDCQKPVFVLYPNYALPDLSFLNGKANIYLNPIKVNISPKPNEIKKRLQTRGKRPFSCNDLELLKRKGLGHIRDWDSLNFLLPAECRQVLAEIPELSSHVKETKCRNKYFTESPNSKHKNRPMSCDCNALGHNTTVSSSSSTATQPSSGYRGSSTMLSDSAQNSPAPNPLFVYRYDSATSSEASGPANQRNIKRSDEYKTGKGEITPPRPPLPKSILRKSLDKSRKSKRYSMFEIDDYNTHDPMMCMNAVPEQKLQKRRSLQEPYYLQNVEHRKNNDIAAKMLSQQFLDAADKDAEYNECYQDEGVGTESSLESGKSNEMKYHRPRTPPLPKPRTKKIDYTEFPPPGALISSADLQELEEFLKLSGFNCQYMDEWDQNQVQKAKNLAEIPICEESEGSPDEFGSPLHRDGKGKYDLIDIQQKRALISNVTDAVEMIIQHFSTATDQTELAYLGDSKQSPACAKIALNALCPALYAVFRDGLKENIETSFGAVNNSVWQMVEATARQGPITKSLNELVLRINSEDAVTEGLVKFSAFILGLLNAQSVDAWVTYMRTRESILSKHYDSESLMLAGCVGEPRCRSLLDALLASLEPLKLLPFSLDLMFEMRELHRSFKKIENEMRAASRLESSGEENWRAESASSGSNAGGGGKFRRLQLKWERISNADSAPQSPTSGVSTLPGETSPAASRSKIPRPVSSPVRPQTAPSLPSPQASKNPTRNIPVSVRKTNSPTTAKAPPVESKTKNSATRTGTISKRPAPTANRTSRVDQTSHTPAPRPSSLPYGRAHPTSAPRRAASSSASRPQPASKAQKPKYVRTLWHRLPSDSGHLAFNEGERLKLILEVDGQYLLCCRGDQKGLVPKDAVLLEDF